MTARASAGTGAGGSRTAGTRRRSREALTGWLLVTPQLAGVILFVIVPLITVFQLSTTDFDLLTQQSSPVGTANFERMFQTDPTFWRSLGTTGLFAAGLVVINITLSLVLALALNRKPRGGGLILTLIFLPVVTSQAAWAIVWRFLLQGEHGTINSLLDMVGITGPNWLFESWPALISVTVVAALKSVGLKTVIFYAALQGIPQDVVEAARLDGASEWQVQRRIILPLLAPTTLVVVIITVIGSMQVFDYIQLMTHGGPAHATTVLAYYIYQQAFELLATGYASALAVVLFVVTLILVAFQWFARKKWVHNE